MKSFGAGVLRTKSTPSLPGEITPCVASHCMRLCAALRDYGIRHGQLSAQLTGYFGYDPARASLLQLVSDLFQPTIIALNGSRIGPSDSSIYALEKVPVSFDTS
jgi:hypothetical protein